LSEPLYKIVLTGYTADKGEYYIEVGFSKLFKISYEEAKELFKNVPTTIKDGLSIDQAKQYKKEIEKIGAKCEIDDMRYDFSGLSID
jgi:transcriptional regulator CtsR